MKSQIKYNIGLDFGTYQSKVCVLHTSADPQKHEFVQFSDNENNSFFIPSHIDLLEDDTFRFGFPSIGKIKKSYDYFKIASAEDEEFRINSGFDKDKSLYNNVNNFEPFTPEFLSVLYITYLLLYIKQKYREENKNVIPNAGSLIQKYNLIPKTSDIELLFSVQLGIPTEYSQQVNLVRRRKFETILLLSEILQKEINSIEKLHLTQSKELIQKIEVIFTTIKNDLKKIAFPEKLKELRISVFPETAAGLTFLVYNKKIPTGFYSALDIGAGSSDISFFKVNKDYSISYLAAEAYIIATNNVYMNYLDTSEYSNKDIKLAELEIRKKSEELELIQENSDNLDIYKEFIEKYIDGLTDVYNKIDKKIYRIFNGRVYPKFKKFEAVKEFKNQPCFVYGGGSKLYKFFNKFREFILHDNGVNIGLDYTSAKIHKISEFLPESDILPQNQLWKADFELLVTAFGLSFEHIGDKADYFWNISDYQEISIEERILIPHPSNEDMFVYDVIKRIFSTQIVQTEHFKKERITNFSISNFHGIRQIESIQIPENTQWIFFTGENGYGKTSVLRALVLGMNGNKDGNIILTDELYEINIQPRKEFGSYVFAAYGTSRLSVQSSEMSSQDEGKSSITYSIFNSNGVLLNIENYLSKWYNDNDLHDLFLKTSGFLLNILDGYIEKIIVEGKEKEILYKEFGNDKILKFNELAAGFKNIIAMIGDIIIRLFIIPNKYENISDISGIVIIDEFENHLHPKWQKDLVLKLSKSFPNVQFFVSTHSPIPLLGTPENSLIIKVDRNENEGIIAKVMDIDYSVLLPNSILSSPIFNFQNLIAQSHTNKKIVETNDDYSKIKENNEIEQEISKQFSNARTKELLKLLKSDKK